MSLSALKRLDPYISSITDLASQVALYTFNNNTNEWEKTNVEGTLFVYSRLASPRHGFTILNRLSMDNLTEPITKDLDFQLQHPFLLYRNARLSIYGIWFYDKEDCQRIAELMKNLAGQEQQLQAQIATGCLSPRSAEQGVDIMQMLTKARNDYDKGKLSEPKEIGSGGIIYGQTPHLIKPIPLKPAQDAHIQAHTQHDVEMDSKHLSVVTLFGAQPKPDLGSTQPSLSVGRMGPARSSVARSLSYDDPSPAGGAVVSSTPMQHCPAIHKLMSGSLLQPLSESPESRLCENGAVQIQPDPIQKLLMNPPPVAGTTVMPSIQLKQGEVGMGPQIHSMAKPSGPFPAQHLFVPNKVPSAGVTSNVVSPHELLQKLTLVQQEQELHPHQEVLQPGLTTSSSNLSKTNLTQVMSPQRIPATVAPTLLLSPSVFAQTKVTRADPEPVESRALSKSQLQATLLHLIKNDASFLDTIYEAYVSRLTTDSSSKPF